MQICMEAEQSGVNAAMCIELSIVAACPQEQIQAFFNFIFEKISKMLFAPEPMCGFLLALMKHD